MYCHQNAWQTQKLTIANKSVENVKVLKYSGTIRTVKIAFVNKLSPD
jgi:RNase P/RNase MRP subunit POP5